MAAAITGFTLITQSDYIVRESLNSMMRDYDYGFGETMDWVQKTVTILYIKLSIDSNLT